MTKAQALINFNKEFVKYVEKRTKFRQESAQYFFHLFLRDVFESPFEWWDQKSKEEFISFTKRCKDLLKILITSKNKEIELSNTELMVRTIRRVKLRNPNNNKK